MGFSDYEQVNAKNMARRQVFVPIPANPAAGLGGSDGTKVRHSPWLAHLGGWGQLLSLSVQPLERAMVQRTRMSL